MNNQQIAKLFQEIAKILEIKGDNPFRVRAYQKAAQNIENLTAELQTILKEGKKLDSIPGIGKDLSEKIKTIIQTNSLPQYEELKKSIPPGLLELMQIPDLGPKTIKLLYNKLNIASIQDLENAALNNKLQTLPRIKKKTEQNILKGIQIFKKGQERAPLLTGIETAEGYIGELSKLKEIKNIQVAGSVRRRKETIKDIDILATSLNPENTMEHFVNSSKNKEVKMHGKTKSSVLSRDGLQVDFRVVEEKSFGAALLYFTGSKSFNVALRHHAVQNKYKVNEYGMLKINEKSEKRVAGKTEKKIFKLFKIKYIPPMLREGGEIIDKALKNKLPKIIQIKDIKGDFHVHSEYSDGSNKIKDIAKAAKDKGYQYIAICDHSQSLKVAHGLEKKRMMQKIKEIEEINSKIKNFRVLMGTEVDILSNGKLDYPDSILKKLDIVVASVHTGFKQSKEKITKRIIQAVKNKNVDIIGHPTGRLLESRPAYEVDLEKIIQACSDYKTALELNAFPQRLDIDSLNCRKAKENNVKVALGTDSHAIPQLKFMQLGTEIAQRGHLEKKDVLNTYSIKQLLNWVKK